MSADAAIESETGVERRRAGPRAAARDRLRRSADAGELLAAGAEPAAAAAARARRLAELAARGSATSSRERRRAIGIEHARRPARARPALLPRPGRGDADRRAEDRRRRRRSSPRSGPRAGRGRRGAATCASSRRRVADETGPAEGELVQPGLARRAARARRRGCCSTAASTAAASASTTTSSSAAPRRIRTPSGRARWRWRSELPAGIHTTGLVPTHPASEGLRPQKLREWAWQALARARDVHEPLPAPIRFAHRLAGAADARLAAHFPADPVELEMARHRLAYEELFLHQAALALRRGERDEGRAGGPARRARPARPRLARARCRSSRPPISAAPSPRSTPTSPAAGRCSAC